MHGQQNINCVKFVRLTEYFRVENMFRIMLMTLTQDLLKKPSLTSEFKLIRCSHKHFVKVVQTI
jgi:hypothetical protein